MQAQIKNKKVRFYPDFGVAKVGVEPTRLSARYFEYRASAISPLRLNIFVSHPLIGFPAYLLTILNKSSENVNA
jgi:hypothetical protein